MESGGAARPTRERAPFFLQLSKAPPGAPSAPTHSTDKPSQVMAAKVSPPAVEKLWSQHPKIEQGGPQIHPRLQTGLRLRRKTCESLTRR